MFYTTPKSSIHISYLPCNGLSHNVPTIPPPLNKDVLKAILSGVLPP